MEEEKRKKLNMHLQFFASDPEDDPKGDPPADPPAEDPPAADPPAEPDIITILQDIQGSIANMQKVIDNIAPVTSDPPAEDPPAEDPPEEDPPPAEDPEGEGEIKEPTDEELDELTEMINIK